MFKQELWKKTIIVLFLLGILLYNSYNNSLKREGVQNNTKYSDNEESLAYQNAATINDYYNNQCSNEELNKLEQRINTVGNNLQNDNETYAQNNTN